MKPESLRDLNNNPISLPTTKSGPGKLSKDLGDLMAVENEDLKKELEEANMKIKELEDTDWKK